MPSMPVRPMFAGCRLPKRSEEHTSELQSRSDLVCRLLLEKKKTKKQSLNNSHACRELVWADLQPKTAPLSSSLACLDCVRLDQHPGHSSRTRATDYRARAL